MVLVFEERVETLVWEALVFCGCVEVLVLVEVLFLCERYVVLFVGDVVEQWGCGSSEVLSSSVSASSGGARGFLLVSCVA